MYKKSTHSLLIAFSLILASCSSQTVLAQDTDYASLLNRIRLPEGSRDSFGESLPQRDALGMGQAIMNYLDIDN